MKIKLFILGLSLGISILSGCNDDLTQVGTGIQPENDRPLVYADTFYMKAKTLQTDSVYARTIYGSLGEIYDPLYGNLKSDFNVPVLLSGKFPVQVYTLQRHNRFGRI